MPFALLFVGFILIASGVKGNTGQLYTLVKGDIESNGSQKGFIYWMVAILIIGSIGYVDELKTLSRIFMGLVIVVLLLKAGNPNSAGGGFFQEFFAALNLNPSTNEGSTLSNVIGSTNYSMASPSILTGSTGLGTSSLENITGGIGL